MSNISPGLTNTRNGHSSTSPVRHRSGGQHARSSSPFFAASQPSAIGQGITNKSSTASHSFLDPTSGSFKSSGIFDSYANSNSLRHNSDELVRRPMDPAPFGPNDVGTANYTAAGRPASNASVGFSGYNSSAASRSGSLPPSRHGVDPSSQFGAEYSNNLQSLQIGASDGVAHRPNQLSRTSTYSNTGAGKYTEHGSSAQYGDLALNFSKIDLGRDTQDPLASYYDYSHQTGLAGGSASYGASVNGLRGASLAFEPDNRPVTSLAQPFNNYRAQLGERTSYSPNGSDFRRSHDSPAYSNSGTPPLLDHQRAPSNASIRSNAGGSQAALLERRLRGLQQEQQGYLPSQQNPLQYRTPFTHPYDYSPQSMLRMNPSAPYYAIPPIHSNLQNFAANRAVSQTPTVDSNAGESLRSTLLEEFRSNNKGTKRYELKVRNGFARQSSEILMIGRTFTTMSSSSVEISMVRASSNKSLRMRIAMRRSRSSGRYFQTHCN